MPNRTIKPRPAFTLLELLVVIAIIMVLLGILLPALGMARRTANTAVCAAHMRNIGVAMNDYSANNREQLAGPNTSGWHLTWDGHPENYRKVGRRQPTQNVDWVSPTMGETLGLPPGGEMDQPVPVADQWEEKVVAIFNHELRCPSNNEFFDPNPVGGGERLLGMDQLSYSSYSATLGFHLWPMNEMSRDELQDGVLTGGGDSGSSYIFSMRQAPRYRSLISQVGPGSRKIAAIEGARFVALDAQGNPRLTFNSWTRQIQGGNFMTTGPTEANGKVGTPYFKDPSASSAEHVVPTELTKRLALRHPGATMNAVFFDGHVENIDMNQFVKVDQYWPTDAVLERYPSRHLDPNAKVGRIR